MLVLIVFAFIGGVVTVLSPCILPILPIVLSGSVGGGKRRPWGIVTGFVAGFTLFTLFLTALVNAFGVSPDALRTLSIILIALFGVSLIVPAAQHYVEKLFGKLASRVPHVEGDGFFGGVLIGLSLGLLWTPCVGPILASVISLAITGTVTGSAAIITLAYSLGTAIPMFAIMYGGRELISRVPGLLNNTTRIQQVFGAVMIITAIGIYFNVDRQFQTYILNTFPQYGTGLTAFEDNAAVRNALRQDMAEKNSTGEPAPELIPGGQWLNSAPLTLAELKGDKVVLLDIMTYSCINCIRTFPYLNEWWEKYEDDGLVIIGIHTPEFEFEKNPANVQKALNDFGITFPVMQDNNFDTWRAYKNNYWPRKYLIDIHGNIIYDHIGEGDYDKTEQKIIEALKERERVLNLGTSLNATPTSTDEKTSRPGSPEIYFGADRNEYFGNGRRGVTGEQQLGAPFTPRKNILYLVGRWNIGEESATPVESGAKIIFRYQAKDVFMVMGSAAGAKVKIRIDGQPVGSIAGADVSADGTLTINDEKLYHLIHDSKTTEHTLELEFIEGAAEVFTFTFG